MSLLLSLKDELSQLAPLVYALVIVALVLGAAILAVALTASIAKIVVLIQYHRFRKVESSSSLTAQEVARKFLDSNGLNDVKVEKLGFFRALFYGNHYSARKKTIYLGKKIIDSKSVTAVGIALQKVGLALQHKEGGAKFKVKAALNELAVFGPYLFIPIALVGIVIDAFLFNMTGVASIIGCLIGFLFYLLATIFTFLNVKVERRANKQALYMIDKAQLFNEDETESLKKLFKAFIVSYVADAILAFLKFIYYFFKLFGKIFVTAINKK